ncbi:MAG: glutaredoxin domain-containing protein [Candidatus Omnitrophota bacterium]|nr:glutaredoxin domain-containing protein [Candidatus Omnitrophota bacterium]
MAKKVKVYSTPTCPYCVRLKQFLKDNDVAFENIDVSSDPLGEREMVKVSGQMAVPVIDIEGKILVGFEKEEIKAELGL